MNFHLSGVDKLIDGVKAGCVHLCRVVGNALWSHMASYTPSLRCTGSFIRSSILLSFNVLFAPVPELRNFVGEVELLYTVHDSQQGSVVLASLVKNCIQSTDILYVYMTLSYNLIAASLVNITFISLCVCLQFEEVTVHFVSWLIFFSSAAVPVFL